MGERLVGNILQIRDVDPLAGGRVEVSAPAPDLPLQGYSAIIRRGTNKNPFLGPDGWQQVEHAFFAERSHTDGDRILLVFGSDLVDSALRDEDIVEFVIPELSTKDVVIWSGITRSMTLSEAERKPAPVTASSTPAGSSGNDTPEEEAQAPKPNDKSDEAKSGVVNEAIVNADTKSSHRWLLLLIPILLIVGAGGWYLFGMKTPEPIEESLTQDEAEGETDADTSGEEEIAQADQTEETAEPEPQPEQAPELSTFEQGLAALNNNQCDMARNLISRAIKEGSGKAALLMAEQQDSVDFKACMTETPNDIRALSHYAIACGKGVDGAKEKLDLLEADLKRRSDAGNITASEVLRVALPKAREACS